MLLRGDVTKFELKNKTSLNRLGLLAALFAATNLIIGCGTEFSSHKKDGNSPATDSRVKTETDKNKNSTLSVPEIKITGLGPFHYQAEINWSEKLKNISVFTNGALSFKSLSQGVTNCFFQLDHNKEYKIELYATPQSESAEAPKGSQPPTEKKTSDKGEDRELVQEWTIQTPLDIELSLLSVPFGFSFPWDIKAHRVFIDHGLPVITNGFGLKIDTDELIILKDGIPDVTNPDAFNYDSNTKNLKEAASVYTFTDDKINEHVSYDTAGRLVSVWSDGKDGGSIFIKAKKAVGSLKIFLRGQNGADGVDGEPYSERAPSGANGTPALYRCIDLDSAADSCYCDRGTESNENGKRGQKGQPGRNGTNGGRGGNSGSLKLEIAEPSPLFHISVTSDLGISGKPGRAGPPQLGGLSGRKLSEKELWEKEGYGKDYYCKKPIEEGEGEIGDPGADGIKQSNGIIEQNCISIGEGFGRCSN